MYVGKLKELKETPRAVVITIQSLDLLGRYDKHVYLPKTQIQLKSTADGLLIYIPDWLIVKNHIPWCRINEIEAISPVPKWQLSPRIGGRFYDYH
jgi:hypothetical protein